MEFETTKPTEMSSKQLLLWDGIRYSLRMSERAYHRLEKSLLKVSECRRSHEAGYVDIFSDSWLIVDACFRMRTLLHSMPGLKQKNPNLRLFFDRTQIVEELRHFIQHANGDIRMLEEKCVPFWGYIAWLHWVTPESGRTCCMQAGSTYQDTTIFPMINPLKAKGRSEIDMITLFACGMELSLTEVVNALLEVEINVREMLSSRFNMTPKGVGSEICASMSYDIRKLSQEDNSSRIE